MKTRFSVPITIFLILLSVAIGICQTETAEGIKAKAGTITSIEKTYTDGVIDGFTIYLPISYDKTSRSFPLIVFLHGGLGVGGPVDKVNEQPLPQLLLNEKDLSNRRNQYLLDSFIVVSPHLTEGRFRDRQFYNQEEAIRGIINDVKDNFRIMDTEIFLTGLSRGGHGTWGLGARMSDVLAAIVPICGALHGVEDISLLTEIPIFTAHNTGDNLVDYAGTQRVVREIKSITGEAFMKVSNLEELPGSFIDNSRIFISFEREGHDSWTDVYESLALYEWLLSQRK